MALGGTFNIILKFLQTELQCNGYGTPNVILDGNVKCIPHMLHGVPETSCAFA